MFERVSKSDIRVSHDLVTFILNEIQSYLFMPKTRNELDCALQLYFELGNDGNPYGNISFWNVSTIKNMNSLFKDKTKFNANLSKWDTRSALDISQMFCNCKSFKCDLSGWNLKKVEYAICVFSDAHAFTWRCARRGWDIFWC